MSPTSRFGLGLFAVHSALTAVVTHGIVSRFRTIDGPVIEVPRIAARGLWLLVNALALPLILPLDRAGATDLLSPEPQYLLLNSAFVGGIGMLVFWFARGRKRQAA